MRQERFLQFQYPLAQFLYWVSCCASSGFVAIYLQYKGLSNTYIGIVVGFYGVLALIAQPLSSKIIEKVPKLTVRKMLLLLLLIIAGLFGTITFYKTPDLWTITIFILINTLNSCMIPLINTLGMEYVNQEKNVNFGLARGFGSLGWAVSAVGIGFLLEQFSPEVLGYVYILAAGATFCVILSMTDFGQSTATTKIQKVESGFFTHYLKDKIFLFVIVGSFLNLVCHSLCTTYTINIVRNVGGNETAAGLAQFFGAGSEMIGMAFFGMLIRKYGSIRILKISAFFYALRFVFLVFAGNLPLVMFGFALQGPSAGLYVPAAVYFVNERMRAEHKTQGQTIYHVLTSGLASFVGSLLGGRLLDLFGLHNTLVVCAVLAIMGGVCIVSQKEKKLVHAGKIV